MPPPPPPPPAAALDAAGPPTSGSPTPGEAREFRVEGERAYDRSSPLRWILSHIRRYPLYVLAFLVATLGVNVARGLIPMLTGRLFELVSGEMAPDAPLLALADGRLLGALALGAVAILVIVGVKGALELGSSLTVETIGQRFERDAREELYIGLLGKSQTFHNRQRVGDVMARAANDVRQMAPMMNPGLSLILDSLLGIVVPLIFVALIDPRLLAAPLAFVLVFAVALRRYTGRLGPVTGRMRMRFGAMNATLAETIGGIEVVKSTAQEPAEKARFSNDATAYRDSFVEQGGIQARYLPPLLLGVAFAFAFWHGVVLVRAGDILAGELVAYMGLLGLLRFPTFISIFTFTLVQLGIAGAERILALLAERTELDENPTGHAAPIEGEIRFQGVDFAYDGGAPVLRGIDLLARPGETVAIVGQAGSGKTTLTRLVERLYDVSAGAVLVDGVDVRDWSLASLRSQMGFIEQDIFLFSRSVAENIAFGRPDATRAEIEAAARDAQAADFIRELPEGFDTVIGERGATLSGGQRQRLAIARALLTDPRILVLDDSTSAIDSATEDEIQRAIERVLEGRTTLLITHRLSQIRWADRIVLLEGGRIVDQGSHEELLARCALYQRIFAPYEEEG